MRTNIVSVSTGFLLHAHALLGFLRRYDSARRELLEVVPSSRYHLYVGTHLAVTMGETGPLRSHLYPRRNPTALKGLLL